MTDLAAVLFDGVVYSSWLFVMAAGLTLIYGVMKILNIAHGSLYALGAYAAASLVGAWLAGGHAPVASWPSARTCVWASSSTSPSRATGPSARSRRSTRST